MAIRRSMVVGLVLTLGGYWVGTASVGPSILRPAEGSAYWDEARWSYVTGDGQDLCFWKMSKDKRSVVEVTFVKTVFDNVISSQGTEEVDWDHGWMATRTIKPEDRRREPPAPPAPAAAPAPAAPAPQPVEGGK